jgi:hypothetical protein
VLIEVKLESIALKDTRIVPKATPSISLHGKEKATRHRRVGLVIFILFFQRPDGFALRLMQSA